MLFTLLTLRNTLPTHLLGSVGGGMSLGDGPRTVRTSLDRLEVDRIIIPCDPDIGATRIKRADRRPKGWDLRS